jgi:nitroreductase
MIKEEISLIIKSRQSIYPNQFNGRIIPEDVILELLENANHAPSHKMTQPWIFKVFCGDSKNKLLTEILKEKETHEKKNEKLKDNFNRSSHIICVCMKKNNHLLPEWEEISATAMAVQNLWISCVGSNIGGYWSTPKYANKLKSYLSLSNDEKCLGFFYLGVLDSKNFRKIKRKSINEKIQWFR